MRETGGNIELRPVLSREFNDDVLAAGGRGVPDVDRYVEDAAPVYADELGLGIGCFLKMQAADGALARRQRKIVLNEGARNAGLLQSLFAIGFREKPALVFKARRDDQLQAWNFEVRHQHRRSAR